MAITITSLTVLGTACPWKFGAAADNPGSHNALVPYNSSYHDSSAAGGGTGSANSAYRYGQSHAGDTGPTTLAVVPNQFINLQYVSGTVATQGASAGNSTPYGSLTTTLTPAPGSETDSGGYTMPTNVISGFKQFNGNGTVNTSTTTVTYVSGTAFNTAMIGGIIWIANVAYAITAMPSATTLTIATSAGTQTGSAFFFYSAQTSIGGLVGAFTDANGIIISGSTWDWRSWGGQIPSAFTLTSVAQTGVYSGTISSGAGTTPSGASNALVGYLFTISGFTNGVNNGTFLCTASSTGSITLANYNAIAESHAATATQLSIIALCAPAGAAFLTMGINDTVLNDNTGSYSLKAEQMDTDFAYAGESAGIQAAPPPRFPVGTCSAGFSPTINNLVWIATILAPYGDLSVHGLMSGYWGQLFPHGGQNSGGAPPGSNGQLFPY